MNDLSLGLMPSGYSSLTGRDLPSAVRFDSLRPGRESSLSYFAVGGFVSADQISSTGMAEDVVHMRGPAEMLREHLADQLPAHMVPARVVVVNDLPITANGKLDLPAARAMIDADQAEEPVVEPESELERQVSALWSRQLRVERVSIRDDFFRAGGDSLTAVALIHAINDLLGADLPVQAIFEAPTIERLAARIATAERLPPSRLLPLATNVGEGALFCWPGLGGYPMGLGALATALCRPGCTYGIQAMGLNHGEAPFTSLEKMAAADATLLLERQSDGAPILIGYSFGARLAFEVAHRLQAAGRKARHLILLAPGQPTVPERYRSAAGYAVDFANPQFLAVACTVFAGGFEPQVLEACMRQVGDEESFVAFAAATFAGMPEPTIRRIVRLVALTCGFRQAPHIDLTRGLPGHTTLIRARGDQPCFLEAEDRSVPEGVTTIDIAADHYQSIRPGGLSEVAAVISSLLEPTRPLASAPSGPPA